MSCEIMKVIIITQIISIAVTKIKSNCQIKNRILAADWEIRNSNYYPKNLSLWWYLRTPLNNILITIS
jgi:hypothetical protein